MSLIVDSLTALPVFQHIPPAELLRHEAQWAWVRMACRDEYWREGQAGYGLSVLISGELRAYAQDVEVARVGPGDLVGGSSAFLPLTARVSTILCSRRARLLTISPRGLTLLRNAESPIYDTLLRQSLFTAARRLRGTLHAISQENGAPPADEFDAAPTAMSRGLLRALRGRLGATPPLLPLLRSLPGMVRLPEAMLDRLSEFFTPVPMQKGDVLCNERECDATVWLVAQGAVESWLPRPDGGRVTVGSHGPGELVGVAARYAGGRRTVSCTATTAGWLYRVDPAALARIGDPVLRLAWQEAALGVLAVRLRDAYVQRAAHVAALRNPREAGARPVTEMSDESFYDLLRQKGYLRQERADVRSA